MSFLLDTNICSAHIKRPSGLIHQFVQHSGGLYVPTVVLAELYSWAFRRKDRAKLLSIIDHDLLADLKVIDFDARCAVEFGDLQSKLLEVGQVVNPIDLMIAAVARTHNFTLVTHNTKHFQVIPNLRIVDWIID